MNIGRIAHQAEVALVKVDCGALVPVVLVAVEEGEIVVGGRVAAIQPNCAHQVETGDVVGDERVAAHRANALEADGTASAPAQGTDLGRQALILGDARVGRKGGVKVSAPESDFRIKLADTGIRRQAFARLRGNFRGGRHVARRELRPGQRDEHVDLSSIVRKALAAADDRRPIVALGVRRGGSGRSRLRLRGRGAVAAAAATGEQQPGGQQAGALRRE